MADKSFSPSFKRGEKDTNLLYVSDMLKMIGDQITKKDLNSAKHLYKRILPGNLMSKISDGFSFLLALEKLGRADGNNFRHLEHLLEKCNRTDLIQHATLRMTKTVAPDPVAAYLLETAGSSCTTRKRRHSSTEDDLLNQPSISSGSNLSITDKSPSSSDCVITEVKRTKRVCSLKHGSKNVSLGGSCSSRTVNMGCEVYPESDEFEIKQKITCDIRLRVRAEYCDHESALARNVVSNKPHPLEQRFERFTQANTILKARDLGSIICDIKFSELTYLDAFWRDYINGSLLDALKEVFITESLKQAVGNEAIKLLVNVDEDDYESGRVKLLKNLTD